MRVAMPHAKMVNGASYRRLGVATEKQPGPPLSQAMLATGRGRYAALLAAIVVGLAVLPSPAVATEFPPSCDTGSRYVTNSTFQTNLNLVEAALPANASASPAGFATASIGAAPDQANALALCRGDVNASTCATCVAAAFRDGRQACPLIKGATVYRDACVLRYASTQFLDFIRDDQWMPSELVANVDTTSGSVNATNARFSAAVTGIFTALVDRARAASNSTRKYFATGVMEFDPKIYGLAQCAPDLSPVQCYDCLGQLVLASTQFQSGRSPGTSVFVVWCQLRYSVLPLYEGRAMLQLPAPPPESSLAPPTSESGAGTKRSRAGIYAGIACSVVLVLILSGFFFVRSRRRIKVMNNERPLKKMERVHCTIFDLPTLQEATEHFSEMNKLGEGGSGAVYKGILSDGQEIAVKTLLGGTGHGLHQLHKEVMVLAELQHKNLVRLHGFCSHGNETLLVYEFIKNGSLGNFLSDDSGGNALNWRQQHNIILGIAKGILYLHEDSGMRIIHQDLKANNILLDDDMEPKIARSGLARLLVGEGHAHPRTASAVVGASHMAPEYAMDIFSFGVLALEIVTRRSNCSSDAHSTTMNLLTEVWGHWTKGTITQMLHQSLDGYARSQALRCIHVGLLSVQQDPEHRPDASTVVFMLTRDSMELRPPSQPAFFFGRELPPTSLSNEQSSYLYDRSDFELQQDISVNGIKLTEPYPR
ncbi:hypothetical protein BS78_02G303900 [Paspalum vaginatum]|nr:hypothetical protein BS78_02G303900 [Paspalum vaginatum]